MADLTIGCLVKLRTERLLPVEDWCRPPHGTLGRVVAADENNPWIFVRWDNDDYPEALGYLMDELRLVTDQAELAIYYLAGY